MRLLADRPGDAEEGWGCCLTAHRTRRRPEVNLGASVGVSVQL
jgi:hypothetical protein